MYLDGKSQKFEDVNIESPGELQPGEYIVFAEVDWSQDRIHEYVFNTYSKTDTVTIELINNE